MSFTYSIKIFLLEEEKGSMLQFGTKKLHITQTDGKNSMMKFAILPLGQEKWNYTLLSCFLNEQTDFKHLKKRNDSTNDTQTQIPNKYFKIIYENNNGRLYVKVTEQGIFVKIDKKYVVNSPRWVRQTYTEASLIGAQGHILEKPKIGTFIQYKINATLTSGTRSLYKHTSLIFTLFCDYSSAFIYFAKQLSRISLHFCEDTCSIHEFIFLWIREKGMRLTNMDSLSQHIQGYLKLYIQPATRKRRLAEVQYNDEKYYIVTGIYISPYAYSILHDNLGLVQGLMLDTTWKVMPYYVTSILMASCKNTGIPIAFIFGKGETKISYKSLLESVKKECSITFDNIVMLSDQGKALQNVCIEFKMIQLYCLRHYLASINDSHIRILIKHFVKAVSMPDIRIAITLIIHTYNLFKEQNDITNVQFIETTLEKIGAKITSNTIKIIDEEKWKKVSMMERKNFKMPSTTNALESTHGHLNEKTPRNNNFYMSFYRIVKSMMMKTNTIQEHIQYNYQRCKRKTNNMLTKIDNEQLKKQMLFYQTSQNQCHCSENCLEKAMLGIDIPCHHRLSLNASFPSLPINITLHSRYSTLVKEYEVLPPPDPVDDVSAEDAEKSYACKVIQHCTHNKDHDAIAAFVEGNYEPSDEFVNNTGASIISLISQGVVQFSKNQKEETDH